MTQKLYIQDPYTMEFSADITDSFTENLNHVIILNQSYFYPEGGGQPSDIGFISNSKVLDVQHVNGMIYHYVDSIPNESNNIPCKVDWRNRFDLMQQHTGQHVLSAAFEKLYDANTVGFHLSSSYVTIDLDMRLNENEVMIAEDLANDAVMRNLKVNVHYPDAEALQAMPLRKPPKVTHDIRVVEVDDFDFSPCGGTHVNQTGEIGLIKIKRFENHKTGIRIEFICGLRAVQDYRFKNSLVNTLAIDFSVKPEDVPEAYVKMKQDMDELRQENKSIKEQLITYKIATLSDFAENHNGTRIIYSVINDLDLRSIKRISATLVSEPATIALLACVENDVKLVFSRSKDLTNSMKELIIEPLAILEGRGGGSSVAAQGGGPRVDQAQLALTKAVETLKSLLI